MEERENKYISEEHVMRLQLYGFAHFHSCVFDLSVLVSEDTHLPTSFIIT